MKPALTCLALLFMPLSGYGQPAKETPAAAPAAPEPAGPPYQMPNTETFELPSPETGNTYKIVVGFPDEYASTPASKTYPVVYVIDAQWQFPLISSAAGALIYDKAIPPVVLVGISWDTSHGELMALRDQDMMPSEPGRPDYGHAAKFQDFLRHTLIPRIESHYRVNQHRTITGCSTSSMFVFYTMLTQPDLFEGYIGSSPVPMDILNPFLDKVPPDGFKQPTRGYMTRGSFENSPEWSDFTDQLNQKHLKNLDFSFVTVPNEGHAGENAECYTRGLQYVFAPTAPTR